MNTALTEQQNLAKQLRRIFTNKNTDAVLNSPEMQRVSHMPYFAAAAVHHYKNGDRAFYVTTDFNHTVVIRRIGGCGYHVEFYEEDLTEATIEVTEPLFTDGSVGPLTLAEVCKLFPALLEFSVDEESMHLFKGAYVEKDGTVVANVEEGKLCFMCTDECLAKVDLHTSRQSGRRLSYLYDNGAVAFVKFIEGKGYVVGRAENPDSMDKAVYELMLKDYNSFLGIKPMSEVVAGDKISVHGGTYLVARVNSDTLDCLDEAELDYTLLKIVDTKVCYFANTKA